MDLSLLDPALIPQIQMAGPWIAAMIPVLKALGVGVGTSALTSKLFGGSSRGEREALQTQSQVGRDQSALLRAALQHQTRLKELSQGPSASRGIFDAPEGLGFRGGADTNAPDIYGSINFDALREEDSLQKLLGLIPTGTSAVTGAANAANQNSRTRAEGLGMTAGNIVQMLLQSGAFKDGP